MTRANIYFNYEDFVNCMQKCFLEVFFLNNSEYLQRHVLCIGIYSVVNKDYLLRAISAPCFTDLRAIPSPRMGHESSGENITVHELGKTTSLISLEHALLDYFLRLKVVFFSKSYSTDV